MLFPVVAGDAEDHRLRPGLPDGGRQGEGVAVDDLFRRQRLAQFDQLVAGGIAAMFTFQVFVNIGMNVTIMPITGVPLPFMSYGGSAMVINLTEAGILLGLSRRRS